MEIEKADKEKILDKILEEETNENKEGLDAELQEAYDLCIKILRKYCDLDERYYNLIVLWIIGTYFHKEFMTYPYLFFNAMRGSGKSRILNLIAHLMNKGKLQVNMSEAVLFRTAEQFGFCIDEFEGIGKKENATLRELLNSAYKRGMCIERCIKRTKRNILGEKEEGYAIESYKVFTPICMANIWGIEDVVSDRSVVIVLSKTINTLISKRVELFDFNDDIKHFKMLMEKQKNELVQFSVVKCEKNIIYHIYNNWDRYLDGIYDGGYNSNNTTLNYITTPNLNLSTTETTHTNLNPEEKLHYETTLNYTEFFDKITHTQIDGRHLELFLPLFIIANFLGDEILHTTLKTAEQIVSERKTEDITENKDVAVIDFVSTRPKINEFVAITTLTKEFKEYLGEDEDKDDKFKVNAKWFGRALKRLNLVITKRRISRGIEVMLNYDKAVIQMKIFEQKKAQEILNQDISQDKNLVQMKEAVQDISNNSKTEIMKEETKKPDKSDASQKTLEAPVIPEKTLNLDGLDFSDLKDEK